MIDISWYDQNIKSFIIELKKQLSFCKEILESRDEDLIEKTATRDDHLNNLKRMIEHRCTMDLASNVVEDKKFIQLIMGINTIASGLEKIGDHCVSIAHQSRYFADQNYFKEKYDYQKIFEIIESGLDKVHEALFSQNIETGVLICKTELVLDHIYENKLKEIISLLQTQETHASNLVTSLFIFHYLERMGDTLQNIGESIVSAAIGENLKIDQVSSLKESLGFDLYEELKVNDVRFRSIWGTRSGARIGEIKDKDGEINSIFKDGNQTKIEKEKEKIELWSNQFPGVAPKVLNFEKNKDHATILLERLYGHTIKETILNNDTDTLPQALEALEKTLTKIWTTTKEKSQVKSLFMTQLFKRLDDVYITHQEFNKKKNQIGEIKNLSFKKSIERLEQFEQSLYSPFSVLIHGDSNIDNYIYNPESKNIHFIDLHRSNQADYCQDASVFIISCFRLPTFKSSIRETINYTINRYFNFVEQFAKENNDHTFHYRLGLGLVRSFTTSTRFELNKQFAKEMFLRANYLVNQLIENTDKPEEFIIPLEILKYEK